MKNFMYFESEDGGMATHCDIHSTDDLAFLYGWMREDCVADDTEMLSWMRTAEVGESYDHRLGVLVRMKDSAK